MLYYHHRQTYAKDNKLPHRTALYNRTRRTNFGTEALSTIKYNTQGLARAMNLLDST